MIDPFKSAIANAEALKARRRALLGHLADSASILYGSGDPKADQKIDRMWRLIEQDLQDKDPEE